MLKQPSGAAGTSTTTPATAAGAAHPASLRQAHPASLSGPAQNQGSGSTAGKPTRRGSRGSSFSQSVVNRLGHGSVVGQVIGKAAELVDDAAYNIVEKAHTLKSSALDATEIDEAVMDAASNIQKIWRGKEALERVERIRVEVEMTNEAEVRKKNDTVTRVNDYRIGKMLGQGAYGVVLKASKDHVTYAIKVLRRSILKRKRMGKGTAFDSVLREIQLMKQIAHPNCVQLFEVIDDEQRDELYLVMEFVDGGDLDFPISKKVFVPAEQLRQWTRDLTLGLEYLHLMGICHRDIKPENLLLDLKSGRVKLADFGISSLSNKGPGGDYMKVTGGTPHFFSPEMCGADMTGRNIYSGKAADMWAVGICIYMWLYHKPACNAPTQMLLMEEIAKADIQYSDAIAEAPDGFEGHPPALMEMMKALLVALPTQRLRVRDLRRHPFLTNDGAEPLGREGTDEAEGGQHVKSAAKAELREWGQRVITQNRGSISMRVQGAVVPVQKQEADGADEQKGEQKGGEQGGDGDKATLQA